MSDVQRDIGALEARMDAVENGLQEVRADVRKVLEYVSASKGSWRVLVALGSIVTAVSGLVSALVSSFRS